MDDDLGEEMKCLICLDYLYQPVTLIDCLHNVFLIYRSIFYQFCGACYSDWMQKSDTCPFCSKKVKSVKKNIAVNNIINAYLDVNNICLSIINNFFTILVETPRKKTSEN